MSGCRSASRITDPAFRPLSSTAFSIHFLLRSRQVKGPGLGLFLSYGIVSDHRGRIEARSSVAGATFEIYLPTVGLDIASGRNTMGIAGKILIVDDEQDALDNCRRILSRVPYQCVTESIPPARSTSSSGSGPGLILTDLRMPTLDGIEVLTAAKRLDPSVKVVLLTAHASVQTAVDVRCATARSIILRSRSPAPNLCRLPAAHSVRMARYRRPDPERPTMARVSTGRSREGVPALRV